MPSTEPDPSAVRVAVQGTTALICVRGRGSFQMGPALKQFGVSAIEQGCRRLILDMDDCVSMDSTFMGVLAGLALRLRDEGGDGVVVMNLNAKALALLKTLGLDRLIETYEAGEMPDELREHLDEVFDMASLDLGGADKKLSLETMLSAHEDLVRASPDNQPKFQNVLDYLSQDLRKLEED